MVNRDDSRPYVRRAIRADFDESSGEIVDKVFSLDTSGVTTPEELQRQMKLAFGTKDIDVWAESIEDLQTGPARTVLFVWIGADAAMLAAPDDFQAMVDVVSRTASELSRRGAWGAPPEKFPDDDLVEVQMHTLLVSAELCSEALSYLEKR